MVMILGNYLFDKLLIFLVVVLVLLGLVLTVIKIDPTSRPNDVTSADDDNEGR